MCKKRTLTRTSHLLHSFFCIRPSPLHFLFGICHRHFLRFSIPFAEVSGEQSPGVMFKDYHLVDVLLLYLLEPGLNIDYALINYEIIFISGTVDILINGTTLFAAI